MLLKVARRVRWIAWGTCSKSPDDASVIRVDIQRARIPPGRDVFQLQLRGKLTGSNVLGNDSDRRT